MRRPATQVPVQSEPEALENRLCCPGSSRQEEDTVAIVSGGRTSSKKSLSSLSTHKLFLVHHRNLCVSFRRAILHYQDISNLSINVPRLGWLTPREAWFERFGSFRLAASIQHFVPCQRPTWGRSLAAKGNRPGRASLRVVLPVGDCRSRTPNGALSSRLSFVFWTNFRRRGFR